MRTSIIYLFIMLLFPAYSNAQSGWISHNTGVNASFHSVFFVDAITGYAVGNTALNRVIVKTTNGGVNWNNISIPLAGQWWRVFFVDSQTGYVAGTGGMIMKTTDGGSQWNIQNSGISNIIWAIYFTDANTGYAGAEFGKIIKTTNGGTNWVQQISGTGEYIETIYFINNSTGFACGRNGAFVKTTNGGANWVMHNLGTSKWLYDIDFANSQTGYIGGGVFNLNTNIILKTTNSGENWTTLLNSSGYLITAIDATSPDTVYATALQGFILKTTNGGNDWLLQNVGSDTLDEVFFLNNSTGFISAYGGKIYKTASGGISNISQTSSQFPTNYSLTQNYPNPFNPSTKISFDIPKHSNVKLYIYNSLGQHVAELVNEQLSPGSYAYSFDGSNLPSGMYFYTLETEGFKETKKMILLK